ncbi:hypothetical protein YQE_11052, partial [Dendroctonus ponderosae]
MQDLLKPPAHVQLMKQLDRAAFAKTIEIPLLKARNIKLSSVIPIVKPFLLKLRKFKSIRPSESDEVGIYLNPLLVGSWGDFPNETRASLETLSLNHSNFTVESFTLQYEHYSVEAILQAVLPKEQEGCSSFTTVGHIVHVNLREHLMPYKDIIGEVLYDNVPNCKSVVNKTNMIDNTYRNFQMEILKGDSNMQTEVKANNCRFQFDFASVYWNSRLGTEHERIVKALKPHSVLFDVFAGVGPFSIPAAKKKCTVFANDLNPQSFKWLVHNKKLNKIPENLFNEYNMDGRDFIKTVFKENFPRFSGKHPVYVTMNLPALAVEFLEAFVGLYSLEEETQEFEPVTLYVYCFAKGEGPEKITRNLIESSLRVKNVDIQTKITELFKVRTVSSMKEMMRVTLSLDRDILTGVAKSKRKLQAELGIKEDVKRLCRSEVNLPMRFCTWKQRNVNMGKNKKKLNSVFKVAGAKSLKMKAKAKPVKSELKNIKLKTKEKVLEIDKALDGLRGTFITTSTEIKQTNKPKTTPLPSVKVDENVENNRIEATEKLETMQL